MRLFVAIELDDGMKDSLAAMQDQMKKCGVRGNYTKRENFHITLAFIGEYPGPARVLSALAGVFRKEFDISLEGAGSFGSLWWAGLSHSEELKELAAGVRSALSDKEIPYDKKTFSPHITLIRRPSLDKMPRLTIPDTLMTVSKISVMRSDRTENGMVYTEVAAIGIV